MSLLRFKGEMHYVFIPFILILYAFHHPFVWVIIPYGLWRLFHFDKAFLLISVGCALLVQWRLYTFEPFETKAIEHQGIVTQVENDRDYPRLRLKGKTGNFLVYKEDLSAYAIGDHLVVEGSVDFPLPSGFLNGFNYEQYLHSINIDGIIYADAIHLQKDTFTLYNLKGLVYTYIDRFHPESGPYLKAFILASRSQIDNHHYETVQSLGIAHLFAVSGLHVGFMVLILKKGLMQFIKQPQVVDGCLGAFLLVYLFITGFAPSVIRASLMFCLLAINNHYKLQFSALDCVMALCMGLLLIHPHFIYQVGFQLSFLVSITLVLGKDLLKGRALIEQSFLVSALSFLISAPIILSMQGSLNIMSVLFNVLYVLFMTFIMLPMAYITFVMPLFDGLMGLLITFFEMSVHAMDGLLSMPVKFLIPQGLLTVGYILIVYAIFMCQSLKSRAIKCVSLIGMIVLVNLIILYNPFQSFVMYDVDGDAFLLSDRFNQCNILIDVGNKDPHNNLVRQLQHKNIRRLDYVLISHEHRDHYGAYPTIDKHFKIVNTITNHAQYSYEAQWHQCGNIEFYIYPKLIDSGTENDKSMIVKVKFMDQTMLFTGDIEQRAELAFIERYDIEVDILKVAHHGSITSSSEAFLDHINASKAFVPARRNNRFDHPSEAVIQRLVNRGMTVYALDETGSIEISTLRNIRLKKTALSP